MSLNVLLNVLITLGYSNERESFCMHYVPIFIPLLIIYRNALYLAVFLPGGRAKGVSDRVT